MFERFTSAAREVVVTGQQEASGLSHHYIGTEHLLLGLLAGRPAESAAARVLLEIGVTPETARAQVLRLIGAGSERLGQAEAAALQAIGIDLDAVRATVEDTFGEGVLDHARPGCRSRMPMTRRAKKSLELALREARRLGSSSLRPEHILLGLLREGEGIAAQIIAAEAPLRTVRERLLAELGLAA